MVWWLPSEDANVLLVAFEHLARGVSVDVETVRQRAGADPTAYRRELVRLVYSTLGKQ